MKGIHFLGSSCALHFQYSWKKCCVSNDPGFLPVSHTHFHTEEKNLSEKYTIQRPLQSGRFWTTFWKQHRFCFQTKRNQNTEYDQTNTIRQPCSVCSCHHINNHNQLKCCLNCAFFYWNMKNNHKEASMCKIHVVFSWIGINNNKNHHFYNYNC